MVSYLVIYLFGILIMTTMVGYLKTSKQGSVLRIIFLFPFFAYSLFTMRNLLIKKRPLTSVQCERWAVRLLLLLAATELCLSFVYDSYPDEWGCGFTRFRCPFSFASPPLVSRFIAMDAVTNFFIMPSLSFPLMVLLNVGVQFPARLFPFLVHGWEPTSAWLLACVCLQSLQFLHCRYARELSHRRKFVLQADASAWQERLQSILDGMIPPSFQGAARAGETAVECREDAAVLFCSFPKEGWVGQDPMAAFHQLNRVYRDFDLLVAAEPLACKVEHVGNDYLVVSRIFGPPPAPPPGGPAAARARDCAALAALGGRMMAAARAALGDGGIELRAGVACGPVFAAIIGRSRRFVRGPHAPARRGAQRGARGEERGARGEGRGARGEGRGVPMASQGPDSGRWDLALRGRRMPHAMLPSACSARHAALGFDVVRPDSTCCTLMQHPAVELAALFLQQDWFHVLYPDAASYPPAPAPSAARPTPPPPARGAPSPAEPPASPDAPSSPGAAGGWAACESRGGRGEGVVARRLAWQGGTVFGATSPLTASPQTQALRGRRCAAHCGCGLPPPGLLLVLRCCRAARAL